ncbi:hypothetical protein [Paramaledivibacter caminithermalis]|jgi:uncharacterized protein YpmB|uniref:Peptidase propeptide and YPEB domain-containing protein n=1 Tax=Paramaledivibacter caminithermalis (strain DSM 15212 / CIP 107654 / DViRD3) TaxID=1121301 RepID=A0A1M6LPV5_PARC5|nr:hypothetical protein [Paramaledivibacter caminithermalis]SHJ73225.1 hypothetical protein SAMN02745912_00888 [Paramaledivibacter caminithermalis DSM 15212]
MIINTVKNKENIVHIEKIIYSPIGRPYTVVYGTDEKNIKKVIWLDTYNNRWLNPKVIYTIKFHDGISKEEAISIIKKTNLEIESNIDLLYVAPRSKKFSKKEGVYWWASIANDREIFVDFYTGRIVLQDSNTGDILND